MVSASQWKRAVAPLLGDWSGMAWRGMLAYQTPVDWVLLGVHGEGSGFTRGQVYVSALFMPLFLPSEHLILSHGERVPSGSTTVGPDDEAAFRFAVDQAIAKVTTQEAALLTIAGSATEESAYALLLLGENEKAQRLLAEPYAPDDQRAFVAEARKRRAEIHSLLETKGPDAAVAQLRLWRDTTASNLNVS